MPHANSLANLKPPWRSGEQPKPGERYIQRMVNRAQKAGPQAMRLMTQAMRDAELPISTRLRCAEFIIEHTWPKEAQNGLISGLSGVEFLELRFVAPQPALPLLQGGNSTIEHEQNQALSGDDEAEYGKDTEEAEQG